MKDFERAISNLDLKIFNKIESQSTENDKQTLLACQLAIRELTGKYNYLEIGSYLGGTIQPHLLDAKCELIYSIDKRPLFMPDNRGVGYTYLSNSTARMLDLLGEIMPTDKIRTIDGDTRQMSSTIIKEKIQLCFIDGEHTDDAVYSDFRFCLDVLDKNGAIIFHDLPVIYNAVADCINYLKINGIKFRAYGLPDVVFVVEIGDFPLHKNSLITESLTNNHVGLLFSLQFNDYYRNFANKFPFRFYRRLIVKWKKLNRFS